MTSNVLPDAVVRAVHGVLLPSFVGTRPPAWVEDAARAGLAGVVYFAHNTPDLDTTAQLSARLHAVAPHLLIAIDEEGGDVSRLQAGQGSALPGASALGAVDDVELTTEVGRALGRLLVATGIDLDLAPSLDVNSNPANPVIGSRAFGATAAQVTRHGVAFIHGLHAGGAGACAKHFPGHGATSVDSHLALPVLDDPWEVLVQRDLEPFVAALAPGPDGLPGVDAVMTAHIVVSALGPGPATLEASVPQLLRSLGHQGPILTDALDMGAVLGADGIGETCVQALEAGADLLCLGTTLDRDDEALYRQAVQSLGEAVLQGRISLDRLRQSARRTASLAETLHQRRQNAGPRAAPHEAEAALAALGMRVAEHAVATRGRVTALRGAPDVIDLRVRFDHAAGRTAPHIQNAVLGSWPEARLYDAAAWGDALMAELARSADPLVVIVREPAPGTVERAQLDALAKARPDLTVVHTGFADAFDVWFTPESEPRAILSHGTGRANAAAVVKILRGT